MVSICSHSNYPATNKKKGFKIKALQKKFIVATLAVVFGLGWALGLVATSRLMKKLTLTFQILFLVFVGAHTILLLLLHGVCSQDIRNVWIQCFAAVGRKLRFTSMISCQLGLRVCEILKTHQEFPPCILRKISIHQPLRILQQAASSEFHGRQYCHGDGFSQQR